MSHYDVLGVTPSARTDEIRQAYHMTVERLTRQRQSVGAAGVMEIQRAIERADAAWAALSDARRRAVYDRSLGMSPAPRPPATSPVQPAAQYEPAAKDRTGRTGPWRRLPGARMLGGILPSRGWLDGLLPRRSFIESEADALRQLPRRRLETGLAIIAAVVVITIVVLVLGHLGFP